jgi:thymidylate synthase ThyX
MWAEGVISGTDWENFYNLRCHEDAQPEFRELACAMKYAQENYSKINYYYAGGVHLPFITDDEYAWWSLDFLKRISAARCARVSYYLKDGKPSDVDSDIRLCDRLFGSDPKHLSPAEHVATCAAEPGKYGNFRDWRQFRQEIE